MSPQEITNLILPLQRIRLLNFPSQLLGYSVVRKKSLPTQKLPRAPGVMTSARASHSSQDGVAILPLFACLHWCVDPYKCMTGIWLVPVSEIANGCVKWLVQRARPGWSDPRVQLLAWSEEFSFPSSHAQMAAAVAHFFVRSSSHPDALTTTPAWPAYAFVAAVAYSRVHVGVHYPSDVAVGTAWGIATAEAYCRLLPRLLALKTSSLSARLALLGSPAMVAALALYVCYKRVRASFGTEGAAKLRAWMANACRDKYAKRELDPIGTPLGLYTGMLGVLTGLAVGYSLVDRMPLPLPTSTRNAMLRGIIGNVGLISLFEAIAAATPRRPLPLYTTLRFLKYAMVPVYILLWAPAAFERAGI